MLRNQGQCRAVSSHPPTIFSMLQYPLRNLPDSFRSSAKHSSTVISRSQSSRGSLGILPVSFRRKSSCGNLHAHPLAHNASMSVASASLHFADGPRAGAERLGFDAHLLQHAHEQVGQRVVLGAIEGDVALVLEAAAGQQDRQVVVVVRRRVAQVARIEDQRAIQQRLVAFGVALQLARGSRRSSCSSASSIRASCSSLAGSWPWCEAS